MSRETIENAISELNVQQQKQTRQERRQQCNDEQQNHQESQLYSYQDLNEWNHGLFNRASTIARAHKDAYWPLSTVVMGPAPDTAATPNHIIVAQVGIKIQNEDYLTDVSFRPPHERAYLTFFSVDNEHLKTIQSEPTMTHINEPGSPHFTHIKGDELVAESLYGVKTAHSIYRSCDEIMDIADKHLSSRSISPLKAVRRARNISAITARLEEVEVTIKEIDEAARNTDLNPVLAQSLCAASLETTV